MTQDWLAGWLLAVGNSNPDKGCGEPGLDFSGNADGLGASGGHQAFKVGVTEFELERSEHP